MGVGAPPFGSADYWEQRFQRDPRAFDWLLPPTSLDARIRAAVAASADPFPRVHHVGCGTSALSFQLRRLVRRPSQVLNSDYSRAAVEVGRAREGEIFGRAGASSAEASAADGMRWRTLDLLALPAAAALGAASFAVVVDDVPISLPYALQPAAPPGAHGVPRPTTTTTTTAKIHPLHLLAVHLAYTTAPGGRWLCVSYSGARFPFLPPGPTREDEGLLHDEVLAAGFVHPARLWRLEACERVESEEEGDEGKGDVVHRPRISHYLYVLVRTELRLEVVGLETHGVE